MVKLSLKDHFQAETSRLAKLNEGCCKTKVKLGEAFAFVHSVCSDDTELDRALPYGQQCKVQRFFTLFVFYL